MMWTDTHCHIHESDYPDPDGAYQRAITAGVQRLICVGTDESSSRDAVAFVSNRNNTWASLGIHPHEAKDFDVRLKFFNRLLIEHSESMIPSSVSDSFGDNGAFVLPHSAGNAESSTDDGRIHPARAHSKIIAIGEIGLDYFYDNSPREQQIALLEAQLDLAQKHQLPVIFHVRDSKNSADGSVWNDFWPIFDNFHGLRGVLHSFTDTIPNLERAVSEGLSVGVNGISTFARDKTDVYRAIPLENILLETDAPFLTPVPHRGMVNEPAFITLIAQFIANLRSIPLEELSRATERNATHLFFQTNN